VIWIYEKVKVKKTIPSNKKVIIFQIFRYRSEHRFLLSPPPPIRGYQGARGGFASTCAIDGGFASNCAGQHNYPPLPHPLIIFSFLESSPRDYCSKKEWMDQKRLIFF
jgi:hypothetical protein